MNQEFFTNLPSEIIIDIPSRLPVRTIIRCKRVCKSWNQLLQSDEFAKFHLSKSLPGLVICLSEERRYSLQIFDFVDELDLEHHELHYNPVIEFDPVKLFNLPNSPILHCSANGLLFLGVLSDDPVNPLYICNPITRECMEILNPDKSDYNYPAIGFGVSKTTNQHKVVRIFHDHMFDPIFGTDELLEISNLDCQVYTIGTGSWRSIAPGARLRYGRGSVGAFFNGRLHWLVEGRNNLISCLDLETECFSTFSFPNLFPESGRSLRSLVVLGDYLCLCDNSSDDIIVIWLMKEYGDKNSWREKFVIYNKPPDFANEVVYPLKVFKDDDILMARDDSYLFYYSQKSKSVHRKIDMFELHSPDYMDSTVHKSSFVSLRSFGAENVRSGVMY